MPARLEADEDYRRPDIVDLNVFPCPLDSLAALFVQKEDDEMSGYSLSHVVNAIYIINLK